MQWYMVAGLCNLYFLYMENGNKIITLQVWVIMWKFEYMNSTGGGDKL